MIKTNKINASLSLGVHLALSLLLPFWKLYWIYSVTDYLNQVTDTNYRSPIKKTLLCVFIPFYAIYWVNVTAKLVGRLALSKKIYSNIVTPCTIVALFSWTVPFVAIQQKINEICDISDCESDEEISSTNEKQTVSVATVVTAKDNIDKASKSETRSVKRTTEDGKKGQQNVTYAKVEKTTDVKEIVIKGEIGGALVTRIRPHQFYGLEHLECVTIPSSITEIASCTFYSCHNLTKIIFTGTIQQWNAIKKGDFWDSYTGDYTVYCTDGTIAKQK